MYTPLKIYQASPIFPCVQDRRGYLVEAVRGRSLLHVGCTDAPLTAYRLQHGQLLHLALRQATDDVVGIDIAENELGLLRAAGCAEVQYHDAEHLDLERTFDRILAGDVVEHLNNPGLFLAGAKRHLAPRGELIIGVPSALSFAVIRGWLGFEQVHPDHTFYFSPKTLGQLCARHGFVPTRLVFTVQPADPEASSFVIWLRRQLTTYRPRVAPSIIMHFRHVEEIDPHQVSVPWE